MVNVAAGRLWAGGCTGHVYTNLNGVWSDTGSVGFPVIDITEFGGYIFATTGNCGKIFCFPFSGTQ